jgi:hypothetical protein
MIGGLHLAAVSFALGPRCIAYVVAAYLSAVVVWGSVLMSMGSGPCLAGGNPARFLD